MRAIVSLIATAWLLAACGALPEKPVRPVLYDFGPPSAQAPVAPDPATAIVLPDFAVAGPFESTSVLYRLGHVDANQLRPYAFARWSAQPAQLVRQRLRDALGQERVVLDESAAASLARTRGREPRVLRVELEEFSQLFESDTRSLGLLRLRATLVENTPGGERIVAQRLFIERRPAPTADAGGGVRALAAATDAAAQEMLRWLQQVR